MCLGNIFPTYHSIHTFMYLYYMVRDLIKDETINHCWNGYLKNRVILISLDVIFDIKTHSIW